MTPVYAGIDAGGTSFKCIVAHGPDAILHEHKVEVSDPEATLSECIAFFKQVQSHTPLQALGIASFGPVELNRNATQYGSITTTPKPGWRNTPLVSTFAQALDLAIAFDTDVNGALLAEARWGAAQGQHSAVYVTVGTGVGMGIMCDGHLLHGVMHPEAGHMLLPKVPGDDFAGVCPYHSDCLEGLVAGPALAARLGHSADTAAIDHPVWGLFCDYLAAMCCNLALCYSPARIILGGGVMQRGELLTHIQRATEVKLNGYLSQFKPSDICLPALGSRAGALGAIALAQSLEH